MHTHDPKYLIAAACHAVLFAIALIALWLMLNSFLPRGTDQSRDQQATIESTLPVPVPRQAGACGSESSANAGFAPVVPIPLPLPVALPHRQFTT